MKKEELPRIFADCCGKEGRYAIAAPFFIDGYAYATDGRWCVRTPCETFEPAEGKVPPANDLFIEWNGDTEPTPIPDPTDWPRCEKCEDGMVDCPNCDGGNCTCPDCDNEHQCGTCDGSGEDTCDECSGFGYFPAAENLNGVFFSRAYLSRLWYYGVREVFLNNNKVRDGIYGPLRFVLGDIEGLVMPRMKP